MTTAAKRASKKANKLKGWPEGHKKHKASLPEKWAPSTESSAAAAKMALAKLRKMREGLHKHD